MHGKALGLTAETEDGLASFIVFTAQGMGQSGHTESWNKSTLKTSPH